MEYCDTKQLKIIHQFSNNLSFLYDMKTIKYRTILKFYEYELLRKFNIKLK